MRALKQLVNRCLWITFKVNPRPANLSESMALYSDIQRVVAPHGSIVHYKQATCPVTKERLDKLQVLIEDFDAKTERCDVIYRSEPLTTDLTPLESELFSKFNQGRLQLTAMSRDEERFKHLSVHSENK